MSEPREYGLGEIVPFLSQVGHYELQLAVERRRNAELEAQIAHMEQAAKDTALTEDDESRAD